MIIKKTDELMVKFLNHPLVLRFFALLKLYKPPGFKGNSLFDVGAFFFKSLREENIHLRASSMAYSFFLAFFPFLLFVLTLVAFVPFYDLKNGFLENLQGVLPDSTFKAIQSTVVDILQNQRGGLLSFGLITAIYFSSNGVMNIINALNRSVSGKEKRKVIPKRFLAIGMTIAIILVIIATVTITLFFNNAEFKLIDHSWLPNWLIFIFFFLIRMAILVLGLLIIVSGIYHYAPIRSKLYPKFTFVTPGSILTTLLIISTTLILQYYINNIVAYNTIYGSIGAVIAFLLLLYFNANCILIGFELNRSIGMAQNSRLESRPHIIKKINDINM